MPNPFVKLGAANTSQEVNRAPIEPVLDHIEGDVLPYRGYAYHGVQPTERPMTPEGYSDVLDVPYETQERPEEAVPVRIVNTGSRQIRKLRAFREYADPAKPPRMVLGRDESRTKATIKNTSADDVWIGGSPSEATVIQGYPLQQNETYDCEADQEVYVQSSHATNACIVCVVIEYTVDLD